MSKSRLSVAILIGVLMLAATALSSSSSDTIGFVNYNTNFPIADRIYVEAFDDPKVKNVACYVSRALLGGLRGIFRLVTEPSRVSVSCQKTGPIKLLAPINESENGETVFSERESWAFKRLYVTRFVDRKRRVLIYLAWTTGIIEGTPFNIINTIPVDY